MAPDLDYARLIVGRWRQMSLSFKSDWVYFRQFTFQAGPLALAEPGAGAAVYEAWRALDQLDDPAVDDYQAWRGVYRFSAPDEVSFEPETPGDGPLRLRVRPRVWPVGDIYLECADPRAPGTYRRLPARPA